MSIYTPTWLYIKQHKVTGLKYFGKTISKDPHKYKGSGVRWVRHLAKHGNNTITVWSKLFTDKTELIEYATKFSLDNNIVESTDWANLKNENGLDGTPPGTPAHNKGKPCNNKVRTFINGVKPGPTVGSLNNCGSNGKLKGRIRPRRVCPHCNKSIDEANYHRYHGNNCKLIKFVRQALAS